MITNDAGFTLVEFLVAIVILMVGLLGMLQGINIAVSQSLETVLRNEAFVVGDETMAVQRSTPYDSVATTTPGFVTHQVRGIFKNYSVTKSVFTRTSSATSGSKEIIVDVSWKYKNKNYKHSVSTVVSKSSF